MIAYYYNPKTKETKAKVLLKKELNASIPAKDVERIGDYHLLHMAEESDKPAFDAETQYVVYSDPKKKGDKYVREWVVKTYTAEELAKNAEEKAEQAQRENEDRLRTIHNECDGLLAKTDYLFNTDYDGNGYNNTDYMLAVKTARSTWRRLRQTDELTGEEIPAVPKLADFQ